MDRPTTALIDKGVTSWPHNKNFLRLGWKKAFLGRL